jgi:aminobenzoyl-glutamate utilization protein B
MIPDEEKRGGGSDDIGDISWNVPTVTLRFPSNMAAGPATTGRTPSRWRRRLRTRASRPVAKVVALTVIDFLMKPELVTQAWDYFKNVQTKTRSTPR